MNSTWKNLPKEEQAQLMREMQQQAECQRAQASWYDGKRINEIAFGRFYLEKHPMCCFGGSLYSIDGLIDNEDKLRREILEWVEPYIKTGVAKKITQLLETIKMLCDEDVPSIQTDRIHVENGTYFLNGRFTTEKEFCVNRLPVSYQPNAESPRRWLAFLAELLEPEDILTLQEYMGYVLLPTTKGQKMMILIGKGGEGKSRVGLVLRALLGESMNMSSIQKVETDRFARADLEHKLLMVDDDMKLEALPQTNNIKSIVTLEDKIDLERKGKQSTQGYLYVRFLCFGNGNLNALHDRSYGFFRRQIVLTVKDRNPNREDDPSLAEKLRTEAPGILLWCLVGLRRLMENNFRFTVSRQAEANLREAMAEGNNAIQFMESCGYIRLEVGTMATSKQLHIAYTRWCDDNSVKPLSSKSFINYLKQNQAAYGIQYSTNIPWHGGKSVRGFKGILVQINTGD